MSGLQWREETGGKFVKQTARFRLQVHWAGSREHARFVVLKRRAARAAILAGSGTTGGIEHAMRAAEKMAERFTISDRHDRPPVIVVDDDTAVSGAVADTLRDEGYDAVEATSGEGALRRLERIGRPTILITDLCLGSGMTGLELAATVSDLSPATGVLLMSADNLDGNDVLPHAHLRKPFSAKQLVRAVAATAARCGLQ
jgi:CheY-like chemotaxis protein